VTFALPDLRGRVPRHPDASSSLGQSAGSEAVTLIAAQVPGHAHLLQASTADGDSADPAGRSWAQSDARTFTTAAPDGSMHASALGSSGSGQPHENMMPFLAVSFIISLFGVFPSQG
jgi:microcystin-dependent protein